MPDFFPVQHRIAEPVDGNGEVVELLEIVFDLEMDDVCPTTPELSRGRIKRVEHRVGQSRCHLPENGSSEAMWCK